MKNISSFVVFSVFIFLFYASATQKATVAPTKQVFTYDYKTPNVAKPGSANILLAMVRPQFAEDFKYQHNELFGSFQKSLDLDIAELLADKGYRQKGPFDTYDEMVFADKKDTHIAIVMSIDPVFTIDPKGWKSYIPFTISPKNRDQYYYYSGSISFIGKINIVGYEPLSKEKIWIKSVQIPSLTNVMVNTYNYFPKQEMNDEFFNDPNVYNAIGAALQTHYKSILQKIDAHLDPQEFQSLRLQIKELKSKKGY